MFIVKLITSRNIHTYSVDGGHATSPYDALHELINAFTHWSKDWKEPVYASIMSDAGTYYRSSNIEFSNIVRDGIVQIPLNEAAYVAHEEMMSALVLPKTRSENT